MTNSWLNKQKGICVHITYYIIMAAVILGLRTVIYLVGDLTAGKKWYAAAFGTTPYFDEANYVGFNIGGYELGLQPAEVAVTESPENAVAYWGVTDVAAQLERLIALGAIADEAPRDVGSGIIVAKFKDPWGNVIGLICNPHFVLS